MTALGGSYDLVPAIAVEEARLIDFAGAVWPAEAPHFGVLGSWWRRAGPECAVAAVHRPSGAMAGLCGGRPCTWSIAGRSVPAIAICDWYVAPAHAGKGLGKRLVEYFDAPDRFLYGFSISDAAIVNFKKLGWQGPHASALMVLLLPRLAGLLVAGADGGSLDFEERDIGGGESLGALGPVLDAIEAAHGPAAPARMRRGAADWSWRLSVCGERRYRFCVARHRRGGEAGRPAGYAVVRRMLPGRSRLMDRLKAAIITDLVAVSDDPAVLRALAREAAAAAAALRAGVLMMAATSVAHRRGLAGFLSPASPLVGRMLARRAPQFMWRPQGPAAKLRADDMTLTFADVAIDLDL